MVAPAIQSQGSPLGDREAVQNRHQSLMGILQPYEADFRELSQWFHCRLGNWRAKHSNQNKSGSKSNWGQMFAPATDALESLVSVIRAGTMSPANLWFILGLPPEYERVVGGMEWIKYCQDVLYRSFHESNFYPNSYFTRTEACLFGTGAREMEWHPEHVLECRSYTAGQYGFTVNPQGLTEAFGLKHNMTIEQMVRTFGVDGPHRCSDEVISEYQQGHLDVVRTVHRVVEQNDERVSLDLEIDEPTLLDRDWPIRSIWYDPGDDRRFLQAQGYYEMPIITPRYQSISDEPFGWSPAMKALPTVRVASNIRDLIERQIELVGDPALLGGATMRNLEIDINPGAVNFGDPAYPGSAALQPLYQIAPDINALMAYEAQLDDQIKRHFNVHQLFRITDTADRSNRTAYETSRLEAEKATVLGPVLESTENEDQEPSVRRGFMLHARSGKFPLPPKELVDAEYSVEFNSIVAQSQQELELISQMDLAERLVSLYQGTGDPAWNDQIDPDEFTAEMQRKMVVAPTVLRSDDQKEAIRADRAQQQALQASMEQAQGAADAARSASQADLDGNTALSQLAQQMGVSA